MNLSGKVVLAQAPFLDQSASSLWTPRGLLESEGLPAVKKGSSKCVSGKTAISGWAAFGCPSAEGTWQRLG